MIVDRRPFYMMGLTIGVVIAGTVWFLGPKQTPDQRVAEDLAILAQEPWHPVHVQRLEVHGGPQNPTDVFVHGVRPSGTPVLVHFVPRSPYTSSTAMRRLLEQPLEGQTIEILMVPRSLVRPEFRDRFHARATHAGVALFAGLPPAGETATGEEDTSPATAAASTGG
ncbi:MAG: hypothetical protein ACE5G2_10755 [Candidatus Krumholzibacteriia bacterium]